MTFIIGLADLQGNFLVDISTYASTNEVTLEGHSDASLVEH